MTKYVVGISVDKVQTFLYRVIHAQEQEMQSNDGTLRGIMGASDLISGQFFKELGLKKDAAPDILPEEERYDFWGAYDNKDVLLKCSGLCVFTTGLEKHEIERRLDNLFKAYYLRYDGQLLVKYVVKAEATFQDEGVTDDKWKKKAIDFCKKAFKQKECLNNIIKQNQAELFAFQKANQLEAWYEKQRRIAQEAEARQAGETDQNEEQKNKKGKNSVFVSDINDLREQGTEEKNRQDERFRIAVIKADLDGMGALLEKIDNYPTYDKVSKLLSKHVRLKNLKDKTYSTRKYHQEFKLYPIYAAGDDIFFAVPASYLVQGIDVCKYILKDLNDAIKNVAPEVPPLSLSIGVDFTFNREPIRYYYERVEAQMQLAKQAEGLVENEKKDSEAEQEEAKKIPHMKICIGGMVLYSYEEPKKEQDNNKPKTVINIDGKLVWHHFLHTVKLVQWAEVFGFMSHHYLYGLLQKITNPKLCSKLVSEEARATIQYGNAVLYHLLPCSLENNAIELQKLELLIVEKLLEQVTVAKQEKGTRKQADLCFRKLQRERLEGYLRLLLLFTDNNRFQIIKSKQDNSENRNYIKKELNQKLSNKKEIKRVRSTVFNRSLRYLYQQNLLHLWKQQGMTEIELKTMRKIFVEYTQYILPEKKKNNKVDYYSTLQITPSMFHRMKRIGLAVEKCNAMLLFMNEKAEIENEQNDRATHLPYFDENQFSQLAEKYWNEDYVDSLLILYRMNELIIQYKILYPSERKKFQTNQRKDETHG